MIDHTDRGVIVNGVKTAPGSLLLASSQTNIDRFSHLCWDQKQHQEPYTLISNGRVSMTSRVLRDFVLLSTQLYTPLGDTSGTLLKRDHRRTARIWHITAHRNTMLVNVSAATDTSKVDTCCKRGTSRSYCISQLISS